MTSAEPISGSPLPSAAAPCLNVSGVPSVRHRDGGQAMITALPITSLTGTVALLTSAQGESAARFSVLAWQ